MSNPSSSLPSSISLLLLRFLLLSVPLYTVTGSSSSCTHPDWVICPPTDSVTVTEWTDGSLSGITLSNTLISRSWVTKATSSPVFGVWDYVTYLDNPVSGNTLLRSLTPEATLSIYFPGLLNSTVDTLTVGGIRANNTRPGRVNFTLVGNNSMTNCPFYGQGPIDSLDSCLNACWTTNECDAVNWIPSPGNPPNNDCVLRFCSDPFTDPMLSPYNGSYVYVTLPNTINNIQTINYGPFLNRTGLTVPHAIVPLSTTFMYNGYTVSAPVPRYNWTAGRRGSPTDVVWPPNGLSLTIDFIGAVASPYAGLNVQIHYELYVGSPVLTKWVTIGRLNNTAYDTNFPMLLQGIEVESLYLDPDFTPLSPITYPQYDSLTPPLYPSSGKLGILVDYYYAANVTWLADSVNGGITPGSAQPILSVSETPDMEYVLSGTYKPGNVWTSLRVYEFLFDNGPEQGTPVSRYPASETYYGCTLGPCVPNAGSAIMGGITERRGIIMKKFLALIAAQGLENPLQNHLTASDSVTIRQTCTEMASVGWEMLVLSYGSGFDVENTTSSYLNQYKSDIAFCNNLGIEVGGYDLIGWTRDPGHGWEALNPDGTNSGDACFGSGWYDYLLDSVLTFKNVANLTMVETDGPYAGYGCSNLSHTGHNGQVNSVALQSRAMGEFYSKLQSNGVYINAPDSWFMFGISKMGIGYNEGTFRLSDVDIINLVQRQVIYDATYYTLPSFAWSQIPMGTYNYSSTFDLVRFEAAVVGQLSYGIGTFIDQPNGVTFLPVPQVQTILNRWTVWFKLYRIILSVGDFIHIQRPNGQSLDIVLHTRSQDTVPGLFILTNPSADDITEKSFVLPLYYTGILPNTQANITWGNAVTVHPRYVRGITFNGGNDTIDTTFTHSYTQSFTIPVDYRSRIILTNVTVPARSMLWGIVSQA